MKINTTYMSESKFTPAYDNKIYQKYSKKTIQNKEQNKSAFCKDVDLPYNKKVPLLCITYPLIDNNNVNMIQDVMNGILEQPVQIVVNGIGTEKYQKYFTDLAEAHPQKIAIMGNDEENKRKIYAACDMMLVSSDSSDCLKEAKNGMAYGVIPIMPPAGFAEDYNPIREKGTAFVYDKGSPWGFFAAFIRTMENFRFPYDWKNIAMSAMD